MKFTFKTEKATGKWRAFYPDNHIIKLNKIKVGMIDDKEGFKIRLMVVKKDIMEDTNPNCIWKWIEFIKKSESLQDAKDFLNKNIEEILKTYNFNYDE